MHLRPAKYLQNTVEFEQQEPGQQSGGDLQYAFLSRSSWQHEHQQQQTSMSASSSTSMASLNIMDGNNNNNNNNQSSQQFTASSSSLASNNMQFNGKPNSNNNKDFLFDSNQFEPTNKPNHYHQQQQDIIMRATKNSNHNNNSNKSKLKVMELTIMNQVELSTMAAEVGNLELALVRAREAAETFNGLKVACMAQDKQTAFNNNNTTSRRSSITADSGSSPDIGARESAAAAASADKAPPMTTGVSLFELSLMINSNLAAQLANNGHFEESIELYGQLCKLASGGLGQITAQAAAMSSRNSQHEARFLLYRFGVNMGNLHYKMGEFQRALKYYRLTLDRLSSATSANRNLRIKIMHNIALTLIAMGQLSDATTSLNLLLTDNLTNSNSNEQQQQQQNGPQTTTFAYNSNHHQLGLILLVCQYKQADLNSMMATMRNLSKVAICQQYERAFDFDLETSNPLDGQPRTGNESNKSRSSNTDDLANLSGATAAAAMGSRSSSSHSTMTQVSARITSGLDGNQNVVGRPTFNSTTTTGGEDAIDGWKRTTLIKGASSLYLGGTQPTGSAGGGCSALGDSIETLTSAGRANSNLELEMGENFSIRQQTTAGGTASGRRVMGGGNDEVEWQQMGRNFHGQQETASSSDKLLVAETRNGSRQLMMMRMRSIQEDRLERLICNKHKQISRSLIMGCNLMLDLNLDLDHYNQVSANNNNNNNKTNQQQKLSNVGETSVFEFCLKLLATSDCYKALVYELKANRVSGMLMKNKYKLDEAIGMLKGMGKLAVGEQQAADEQQDTHSEETTTTGNNKPALNKMNPTSNRYNTNNKSSAMMMMTTKSSMVATNCSLFQLLQSDTKQALLFGDKALKLDKFNVRALINLANAYYMVNDFEMAENLYERAQIIEPYNWEANYNLTLLNRKLGRHYNELKEPIKSILAKCRQAFSSLIWHRMILMVVQMALIYHQSGLKQQSYTIINDLLSSPKQAPEILLLASKLMDDPKDPNTTAANKPSASSILRQANRDHPYHLPVAERLIALNIQSFNYDQSIALLCNCIINRPDLVKWYQMLAECYRRAADYNKAIATYKIAVDAFPQDTGCLKALVKLTDELGLTEEKRNFSNKLEATNRRLDLQAQDTLVVTGSAVDAARYQFGSKSINELR